jgi:hypothetical protein
MQVTLPSGMSGEIRGLKGKDGRYLTDEEVIRGNELEDFILQHCWTRTIDAGPYALKGAEPDWDGILVGDRSYALIAARVASYPGKEYPLKLQCGQVFCKRKFEWEIQLADLLAQRTKKLSPEHAEIFKGGNRFVETIPGTDKKFTFKLKTGGDAKRTMLRIENKKTGPKRQQERQNLMVDSLASSIVEIEGVEKKYDAIFDFLEDLELGSIDALLPLMQSYDCGVDTSIEVDCTKCKSTMMVNLPFERAFFLPSSAAAKFLPDASSSTETDAED